MENELQLSSFPPLRELFANSRGLNPMVDQDTLRHPPLGGCPPSPTMGIMAGALGRGARPPESSCKGVFMLFDSSRESSAPSLDDCGNLARNLAARPVVRLASTDPGLPPRLAPTESDSQCDCACRVVESEELVLLQTPISFYLELTPFCNNRCHACGNVFVEQGPDRRLRDLGPPLSVEEWEQILAKIQRYAHRL
jgi:hypothetical protein